MRSTTRSNKDLPLYDPRAITSTKEDRKEAEKAKAVRRTAVLELGRTSVDTRRPATLQKADSFTDLNELLQSGDAHLDTELQRLFALKQQGKLNNADFERLSPMINREDSPKLPDDEPKRWRRGACAPTMEEQSESE